jgi:hypothetical protein
MKRIHFIFVWPSLFKGWVGGFRPYLAMDNFCPTLFFFPPKNCPWQGGVEGNQSSWKAFPTFRLERSIDVARMDQSLTVSPTLWSPGSSVLDPRPLQSNGEQNNQRDFPSAIIQFHMSVYFVHVVLRPSFIVWVFLDVGLIFGLLVCRRRRLVARVWGTA